MEEMLKQQGKKAKRVKKGRKRKKRKEVVLTPKQRYDQAVALKRAIRCMLKVQDRYMIYTKLCEDFAELAALPETESFEGKEECAALSEECRTKAEELKDQLPEEEEDSRTVTTTVKQQEESEGKKRGKGKWIVLAAVVLIVGIIVAFQIDGSRYVIAHIEKGIGFKDMARDMFQSLDNYSDSEKQAAQIEQTLLGEARKGATVKFGKTDWIVLRKKENAVCIMKKEGEKKLRYHEKPEAVNWATSDLRRFLNDEYLNKYFTQSERELIQLTDVPVAENKEYSADAGNLTQDYVYILSSYEVHKYKKILNENVNNMRLRNPGKEGNATEFVSGLGEVVEYGYPVDKSGMLIRPVMWISLE